MQPHLLRVTSKCFPTTKLSPSWISKQRLNTRREDSMMITSSDCLDKEESIKRLINQLTIQLVWKTTPLTFLRQPRFSKTSSTSKISRRSSIAQRALVVLPPSFVFIIALCAVIQIGNILKKLKNSCKPKIFIPKLT